MIFGRREMGNEDMELTGRGVEMAERGIVGLDAGRPFHVLYRQAIASEEEGGDAHGRVTEGETFGGGGLIEASVCGFRRLRSWHIGGAKAAGSPQHVCSW
jgi:hypothetical protein